MIINDNYNPYSPVVIFGFKSFLIILALFSSVILIGHNSYANEEVVALIESDENTEIEEEVIEMESDRGDLVGAVVLQGLNKITAKTSELNIEVGRSAKFGELEIALHKCWVASPDQRPESKALISIYDNMLDQKKPIFYGWMFASTTSITGLEHPIYDVVVLNCKEKEINNE